MNELMKKGAYVRITKQQTLKSPGEHFTLAIGRTQVGTLAENVIVGKPVLVQGSHMFDFIWTTAVQKIDGDKIETKNSIWVFSKP